MFKLSWRLLSVMTKKEKPVTINWNDPREKISQHFTVKEATWLHSWSVCHRPSDQEKANILKMALSMDEVRDALGKPINVHCWMRPGSLDCDRSVHHGEDYNKLVGGALHSAHKDGSGVDFDCGEVCDETRKTLLPLLDKLGLCMENKPGSSWVHLDNKPPRGGKNRYFIP